MSREPTKRDTRSYDSPRRRALAEDTQAAVVGAAAALFSERGWSGTGMRDIARSAGVSVETVYASGGSKVQLLLRALDVGIVGDTAPAPLAQRPEFLALGSGSRRERLTKAAQMVSTQYARVALLHRALETGATVEEGLASRLAEARTRQHTSFADGLALILDRPAEPQLAEGLQAIASPDVYLLLVHAAGWSARQYEEWLADTMGQLLLHIPEESPS